MVDLDAVGLRSYVSEPRRGKRRWRGDRQGQEAVYANRRRIRGERGQSGCYGNEESGWSDPVRICTGAEG